MDDQIMGVKDKKLKTSNQLLFFRRVKRRRPAALYSVDARTTRQALLKISVK